jgi:hypothetical protein
MRLYTSSFKFVTISAAQDLIVTRGGSAKLCVIRRVWIYMNDTTLQTAQGLRLNVKLSSATWTNGSGGSAPTPRPVDQGDSAATFTARANDTTPGTTSGAFTDITPTGGHNYAGYDYTWPKGEEPVVATTSTTYQACIFELLSTVSGTCNFSGGVTIGEQG